MNLERKHWEQCKIDNTNLILQSQMTIEMAERILVMVEEKLKEFPEETKPEEKLEKEKEELMDQRRPKS